MNNRIKYAACNLFIALILFSFNNTVALDVTSYTSNLLGTWHSEQVASNVTIKDNDNVYFGASTQTISQINAHIAQGDRIFFRIVMTLHEIDKGYQHYYFRVNGNRQFRHIGDNAFSGIEHFGTDLGTEDRTYYFDRPMDGEAMGLNIENPAYAKYAHGHEWTGGTITSIEAGAGAGGTLADDWKLVECCIQWRVAKPFSNGSGTTEDPYLIGNADDLIALSQYSYYWRYHFKQTANIAFNSDHTSQDWNGDNVLDGLDVTGMQPIGVANTSGYYDFFYGSYDGNGYLIENIYMHYPDKIYIALFGFTDEEGKVSNLGLENVEIYGDHVVGGLIGRCRSDAAIENCFVTGFISANQTFGGLVGQVFSRGVQIKNCFTNVQMDVTKNAIYVAGLVGYNSAQSVTYQNCYSVANTLDDWFTCGLLGHPGYDMYPTISKCYYNSDSTEVVDLEKGTPRSTARMKQRNNYTDWDFETTWSVSHTENDGYPNQKGINTNDWTGYEDQNWNNPDNWNQNEVPANGADVYLLNASKKPLIEANNSIVCGNINIGEGSKISLSPSSLLKVNGALNYPNSNDTIVVINSDATGTGKLFVNETLKASINQYIHGGDTVNHATNNHWHYFTLPIQGEHPVEKFFKGMYVSQYSEADDSWTFLKAGDVLKPGVGYAVWATENATISFTGNINTNNIEMPLLCSGQGFNFIGNPYTCAIDWEHTSWDHSSLSNTVYVWNPDLNNYSTYTAGGAATNGGTRYIAPMQGFHVQANAPISDFELNANSRVTEQCNFKSTERKTGIGLIVKSSFGNDELIFITQENTSDGFDLHADAKKIIVEESPQLYTLKDDEMMVCNAVPKITQESQFPIHLKLQTQGVYELKLSKELTIPDSWPVLLYNHQTSEVIDLRNESFNYNTAIACELDFTLMFSDRTSDNDINNQESKVFATQQAIQIQSDHKITSSVDVYSIDGRKVLSTYMNEERLVIPFNMNGVYIVRFWDCNREITKRIGIY